MVHVGARQPFLVVGVLVLMAPVDAKASDAEIPFCHKCKGYAGRLLQIHSRVETQFDPDTMIH